MKIGELVEKIIPENGKPYYISVSYGHSRTIQSAWNREAIIYALSFAGAYIIFKKRGGYLGYYLFKDYGHIDGGYWRQNRLRSQNMSLKEVLNAIVRVKENGLGITNFDKENDDTKAIINSIILESL